MLYNTQNSQNLPETLVNGAPTGCGRQRGLRLNILQEMPQLSYYDS